MNKSYNFFLALVVFFCLVLMEISAYGVYRYALIDMLGNSLDLFGISSASAVALALCLSDVMALMAAAEAGNKKGAARGADRRDVVILILVSWFVLYLCGAFLAWWGFSVAITMSNSVGAMAISRGAAYVYVPVGLSCGLMLLRMTSAAVLISLIHSAGSIAALIPPPAPRHAAKPQSPVAPAPRPGGGKKVGQDDTDAALTPDEIRKMILG